jgi:hypothetical protein
VITEVTDLRQTLQIKKGYGETNAWMEWIKYSVHTLNNVNGSLVQQGD